MRSLTLTEIMLEKFAKGLVNIFCQSAGGQTSRIPFKSVILERAAKFKPWEKRKILEHVGDELLAKGYSIEALLCYQEANKLDKVKVLKTILDT